MAQIWLVRATGSFILALGAAHFFLPALLDFKAIVLERPRGWKPPRPLRLPLTRYIVTLRDRLGVIWVSNHAASYVLVSLGLVDLLATEWLAHSDAGRLLALWMGGFWLLRAASQWYFGRRPGDWVILAGFAAIGLLHLWVWHG